MAQSWHLDRRIPLATIFAIAAQGGAILLWGSGVSHNIDTLRSQVQGLQADAKATSVALAQISVEIAKLQTQVQLLQVSAQPPRAWPAANGGNIKRRAAP